MPDVSTDNQNLNLQRGVEGRWLQEFATGCQPAL
jgi:hypothetical protein